MVPQTGSFEIRSEPAGLQQSTTMQERALQNAVKVEASRMIASAKKSGSKRARASAVAYDEPTDTGDAEHD